jgi:hypothetical protein
VKTGWIVAIFGGIAALIAIFYVVSKNSSNNALSQLGNPIISQSNQNSAIAGLTSAAEGSALSAISNNLNFDLGDDTDDDD